MQMTNVVAYYQTRLHQFSECLTNFSPLIGELIYPLSTLPVIKVAGTISKNVCIRCAVDEGRAGGQQIDGLADESQYSLSVFFPI
jgi:hypothetical protein